MSAGKPFFLFLLFIVFCFPVEVYPYIDAGTGSFMLQILIAGLVGSLFALKLFFRRIVNGIRKLMGKSGPPETDANK
ncbi:MAG: hypothetical protein JXA71_00355 [Chitinispirillaceae bacterium]|nr:hypothetical protein [Chitinispirillaceae bacterium]